MNVGPILRRELIEQSRRPDTHLLRVAGGGFIALFLWSALGTAATADAGSGRGLFLALNKLLFALLWMVGPVMTADCLSREKREGTIGLLFLTPLRPVEIVLGKVFVHALRGLTLLAAAFPVLAVPLISGGVTYQDALRMLLYHFSALGLALASGMFASAMVYGAAAARVVSFAFASAAGLAFGLLYLTAGTAAQWWASPGISAYLNPAQLWLRNGRQLLLKYGPAGGALNAWGAPPGGAAGWRDVAYAAVVFMGSTVLVALAVRFAARGLQRTWRPATETPAPRVPACRPLVDLLRARVLDRNPFAWLEVRTTSLTTRFIATLLLGAGLVAVFRSGPLRYQNHYFLPALWLTAAFGASKGFRREAAEGAIELIATTPADPAVWARERTRSEMSFGLFLAVWAYASWLCLATLAGDHAHMTSTELAQAHFLMATTPAIAGFTSRLAASGWRWWLAAFIPPATAHAFWTLMHSAVLRSTPLPLLDTAFVRLLTAWAVVSALFATWAWSARGHDLRRADKH